MFVHVRFSVFWNVHGCAIPKHLPLDAPTSNFIIKDLPPRPNFVITDLGSLGRLGAHVPTFACIIGNPGEEIGGLTLL